MSHPIILESFEELGDALDLEPLHDETDAAPSQSLTRKIQARVCL